MPEELFTIGDVASMLDVSFRTLRFYEEKGLIHPQRSGQVRLYTKKDLDRLRFVAKARQWRFTVAEIANVLASCGPRTEPRLKPAVIKAHRDFLVEERARLKDVIQELSALLPSV